MGARGTVSKGAVVTRVITIVALLVAVGLSSTTQSGGVHGREKSLSFNSSVYSYRYAYGIIIIGLAYQSLAMILDMVHCAANIKHQFKKIYVIQFYGDKVISSLLVSATAAGYGAAVELGRVHWIDGPDPYSGLLKMGRAVCTVLLCASVFSWVSSIFSSYDLERRFDL